MFPHHLTTADEHYATSSTPSAWQVVAAQPFSSHQYHDSSGAQYPIVVPASLGLNTSYSLSPDVRDATAWSHRLVAPEPTPAPQHAFTAFPVSHTRPDNANTLPVYSQPPPDNPPMVKVLPWGHYKEIIQKYYMKEKKTMKELRDIMKEEHHFDATAKQYKDKFKLWGWRRNLRKQEGLFMKSKALKRQQQNLPKDTVFEWGGQEWTRDRVLRSFGTELQQDSINDYSDQPTPYGMTYRTPRDHTSSNIVSTPATSPNFTQVDRSPPTSIASQGSSIRLRWNGHRAADIPNIMKQATDLERQKDFDGAAEKFAEVLDASHQLLRPADELTTIITYQVARFYARQNNMAKADTVLDDLTKQIVRRWGPRHECTMRHYTMIVQLFEMWDRHEDVLHLIQRLTDDFRSAFPFSDTSPQKAQAAIHIDAQTLFASNRLAVNTADSCEEARSFEERFLRMDVENQAVIELEGGDRPEERALRLLDRLMQSPEDNLVNIVRAKQLLVSIYIKAVMSTEAREAFVQAKETVIQLCRLNCSKPREFFTSATDLAEYGMNNDFKDASHVIFEALEVEADDSFGADHAFTISLLIRIGKVIEKMDNWETAGPHFQQAYAACITRFGSESLITLRLERALEEEKYPDDLNHHDLNRTMFESVIL